MKYKNYIYLVLILDFDNKSAISDEITFIYRFTFDAVNLLPWCSVELHPYATLDKTVPHSGPEQGEDSSRVHFQEGRGGGRRLYTRTIMYSTVQWLSFSVFLRFVRIVALCDFIVLFPLVKFLLHDISKSWDNKYIIFKNVSLIKRFIYIYIIKI